MRRALVGVALAAYSGGLSACGADKPADAPRDVPAAAHATSDADRSMAADAPPFGNSRAPDSLIGLVTAPDSLLDLFETREYGYEERALTVYATGAGWYLVGKRDSARAWLRAAAVDSFMPLDSLIHDRLNYLTEAWDGELRRTPAFDAARVGVASALRVNGPDFDRTPTRVLRTRRVDASTWWAEVDVMSSGECGDYTPRVLATGWVPLWGTNRAPTVWYYSRGC